MDFSQNIELLMETYSHDDFLPKNEIVCKVYRSLFYVMGLEISDGKKSYGGKLKK